MPGYPAPSQHILPPSPGPPPGGVGRKPPGPAPDRPARPHVRLSPLAFQHLLPLSYPCGSVPVCLVAPCVPVCVSPGPWADHSEVAISSPLLLPRPCPTVLFISLCHCGHSHTPHSVPGQGTLPGPSAVSHTALQVPTCHPHVVHTVEIFAVNKRFEDCRTRHCVSGWGMDMSPGPDPFVPPTSAPHAWAQLHVGQVLFPRLLVVGGRLCFGLWCQRRAGGQLRGAKAVEAGCTLGAGSGWGRSSCSAELTAGSDGTEPDPWTC